MRLDSNLWCVFQPVKRIFFFKKLHLLLSSSRISNIIINTKLSRELTSDATMISKFRRYFWQPCVSLRAGGGELFSEEDRKLGHPSLYPVTAKQSALTTRPVWELQEYLYWCIAGSPSSLCMQWVGFIFAVDQNATGIKSPELQARNTRISLFLTDGWRHSDVTDTVCPLSSRGRRFRMTSSRLPHVFAVWCESRLLRACKMPPTAEVSLLQDGCQVCCDHGINELYTWGFPCIH